MGYLKISWATSIFHQVALLATMCFCLISTPAIILQFPDEHANVLKTPLNMLTNRSINQYSLSILKDQSPQRYLSTDCPVLISCLLYNQHSSFIFLAIMQYNKRLYQPWSLQVKVQGIHLSINIKPSPNTQLAYRFFLSIRPPVCKTMVLNMGKNPVYKTMVLYCTIFLELRIRVPNIQL